MPQQPDAGDLWGERGRPRPRQLLFDGLTSGLFTLVALVTAVQQGWLAVVATIAMGLALAVRRLAWPAMAVLATATGVCQLVSGELVLLADLGYAAVFFGLGAHPRRWVRRLGLAGAVAAAAVLATAVGLGRMGDSSVLAVVASAALALVVAGGGWAAGFARWQSRARVTAQVQAGLEQERARIATDMHDLVAHTWAVVAAQADGDRKAAEALDVIAETARGSISDLRDLLAELRYQEPATPPGRATRDALVHRLRASGMDLHVVEHGPPAYAGPLAGPAQRLLAESLTNALKHGDLGHPVEVEEDWRDGYRLVVRNRVRSSSPVPGTGHGLAGMRERVELAGGTFAAGADGDTWTVAAVLPGS